MADWFSRAMGGVASPELDAVARQAIADAEPSTGDYLKAGAQKLGRGIANSLAGLMDTPSILAANAGIPVDPTPYQSTVQNAPQLQVDPRMEGNFGLDLVEAVGSVGGMLATGALGGAAGISARAATMATGAATKGAAAYHEAVLRGASPEEAWQAYALSAPLGTLEAVPGAKWVERITQKQLGQAAQVFARYDKAAKGILTKIVTEGGEEFGQEFLDSISDDLIAKYTHSPEEKVSVEKALRNGLLGFIVGGALGGSTGALGNTEVRGRETRGRISVDEDLDSLAREALGLPSAVQGGPGTGTDRSTAVQDDPQASTPIEETGATVAPTGSEVAQPEKEERPKLPSKQEEPVVQEAVPVAPASMEEEPTPKASNSQQNEPKSENSERNGSDAFPSRGEPTTGIKFATVDEELAKMDREPSEHADPVSDEEVHSKAAATIARDPFAGRKLVEELERTGRAPQAEEAMLLAFEANRLVKDVETASTDYVRTGSEEHFEAQTRAQDTYKKFADIIGRSKSAGGRAFRLYQVLLKRDYSLAEMKRVLTVAKGRELTKQEDEKVRNLQADIQRLQGRVTELETAQKATQESERLLTRVRRRVAATRAQEPGKVQEFISGQARAARARIRARTYRASAGVDPLILADYAIIGAEHITKGVVEFKAWSKAMIEELGEEAKPHLEEVYARSQEIHTNSPREEKRLEASKRRTKSEIAKVEGRIERKDFEPTKRTPVPQDEDVIGLKVRLERLRRDYRRMEEEFHLANRTKGRKAFDAARSIVAAPRSFLSSYDLSAVFRQGAFFTLAHPVRSVRLGRKMLQAFASPNAAERFAVEMRDPMTRPGYDFGESCGLELTSLDAQLGPQEEAIRSSLAEKIPLFGRGVKASNRAFITYLNFQRATIFDELVRAYGPDIDLKTGKHIAKSVNILSGRGELSSRKATATLQALGDIFWSPRLFLSRVQTLTGTPLWRGDAKTRKLLAKEYARVIVAGSAIYALGSLAGGDLEDDPRSTDFGKIQFGETRVDPLAGIAQIVTLGGRTWTDETVTLAGKVREDQTGSVIGRFLRSKLTPALGAVVDVLARENMVGEPTTPGSLASRLLVPLTVGDIVDAVQEHGIARGTALSILATLGMGVSTYEPKVAR